MAQKLNQDIKQGIGLFFMVNGKDMVLPLEDVREILNVSALEPVPNAVAHVIGIMNIRGEVVPIIGGRIFDVQAGSEKVSEPSREATKKTDRNAKIIIIGSGEGMKGLLVDYIYGVFSYAMLKATDERLKKTQINQLVVSGIALGESGVEMPMTSAEVITAYLIQL